MKVITLVARKLRIRALSSDTVGKSDEHASVKERPELSTFPHSCRWSLDLRK